MAVPFDLPNISDLWSFVLARSVCDLEAAFGAVGEPSVALELPFTGLRVGMMHDDPDWSGSVDPEVVAGVERAVSLLRARGHSVEESHPAALDGLFRSFGDRPRPVSARLTELTYRWLEEKIGRRFKQHDLDAPLLDPRADVMPSDGEVETAVRAVAGRVDRVLEWWDDFDIMLMPALRQPAWLLGNSDWDAVGILPMEFTHIGFPSLVLPIGMTEGRLRLAAQLTGRIGADRRLLALDRQLGADAP